jgi:hypothetical protein
MSLSTSVFNLSLHMIKQLIPTSIVDIFEGVSHVQEIIFTKQRRD